MLLLLFKAIGFYSNFQILIKILSSPTYVSTLWVIQVEHTGNWILYFFAPTPGSWVVGSTTFILLLLSPRVFPSLKFAYSRTCIRTFGPAPSHPGSCLRRRLAKNHYNPPPPLPMLIRVEQYMSKHHGLLDPGQDLDPMFTFFCPGVYGG